MVRSLADSGIQTCGSLSYVLTLFRLLKVGEGPGDVVKRGRPKDRAFDTEMDLENTVILLWEG